MNKVATSLTPSRSAGVEGPSIDELIKSGSLHQRLAAARAARERVLVENGEGREKYLSDLKPWERPEYKRGESRKTLREKPALRDVGTPVAPVRPAPPLLLPNPIEPAAGFVLPAPIPLAEAPLAVDPVVQARPNRRLTMIQIAAGGAFGIAVGIAIGYWFAAAPLPDATRTIALTDEPPGAVTLRADADAGLGAMALPATDTAPATAALPQLSNVVSSAVPLPAIGMGGPVQRDAARAPELDAAASAWTPGAVLAPQPVAAPAHAGRGELSPPELARDVVLSALSAPARVVVRTHLGSLPATGAAPLALPDLPGAGTTTVNWQTPGAAALPRDIVDAPLAAQDIPLPVLRPAAGPTDVTLIVHAPARLSADAIAKVEATLVAEGFSEASARPVNITVSQSNVRYFMPEDRKPAEAIAAALGAELRDFTDFSPRPRQGTIEVWLAGQGGASSKPAKTSPGQAILSAAYALKQQLVRQLRTGRLN